MSRVQESPNIYLPLFISFFREKMILFYISGKSLAVANKHATEILVTTYFQQFLFHLSSFTIYLDIGGVGSGHGVC